MNCIFICIFNQEKYVEMAYLLLKSIFLYGCLDNDTNIVIYTSTQFMGMIKQNSIFTENGDKIIFEINDTYNTIDKACKARLDLFNLPSICTSTYTKILYLDTDILVKGDINIVFSIIKEDILYTLEEGSLTDNYDFDWHGGKTLFGNEIHNYSDKSAFTSGILLFNNCEDIKNLFDIIMEDIKNRPHDIYDQPYIVYNAFKYNKFNNKILKQYVVNNDHNAHSDKIIHHFPTGPQVESSYKLQSMGIFLANIKDIHIVHNGAKIYNVRDPPIKNTKFPLVAICISYNYFDTLQFTLPVNYLHFDKIYLVTQEDDVQTVEFCKKFDNVYVVLYNFKNNGKQFDKYGALNFAQQMAYEEYPESWYLTIDSDIVLPNNFIDILYKEKLNSNCIYGAFRNNLLKTSEFLDKRKILNDVNNVNFIYNNVLHCSPPAVLGCFQLYKKKCIISNIDHLTNASHGDYIFGHDNFNIFCNLENVLYFHLGQGGTNWFGKIVSFIDDINISLDNIYYIYEKKCNNTYYDINSKIYYNKNPLKYIIHIGDAFTDILVNKFTDESHINIIVNSSNDELVTSSNTIYLTCGMPEKNRILNKLIEDYNIDFIEYLYVNDCDILLDLNLSNIRPINIIFKNSNEGETIKAASTILNYFNLYGYDIEEQTETSIHIKLFKLINIEGGDSGNSGSGNSGAINPCCSEQMRYDIYDFFKNKSTYSIAEIGANKGYLTKILSKIFSKVYAVDNNVECINFNKNLNKDSTNIKYVTYNGSWGILPDSIQIVFINYQDCKINILNAIERFKDIKYIIVNGYSNVKQTIDDLKNLKIEKYIGLNSDIGLNEMIENEGIICSVVKKTIEKYKINCIFSIGANSNSGNFLTKFNLRKLSSPLDFIYVDFETALRLINEKFEYYLSDIVLFNKNAKKTELFYVQNTNKINEGISALLKYTNITHMKINHNKNNLLFNQNYLKNDSNDGNLANWESICIFYNNDILNETIYNSMKGKIKKFNAAFTKYNETTCLLFITDNNCPNYYNYIDKLTHIKKRYNITCFMIIIINCNNVNDHHIYDEENKCLFIIKKQQGAGYENEYNIMLKYFNFNLIETSNI